MPGKRARRVWREAARKRPGFIQHEHGTSPGGPPYSYGFRPGRGCHDAIEAIYQVGKGASPARRWALDADLAAAFDRIGHSFLLSLLGTFPARELVAGWLTAGVVEDGRLTPTGEGTPQGGLCTAAHNPPYEQCRLMRSAGLPGLVRAGSASERCA